MSKRQIKTTINQIYEYWADIEPVSELELNFDWADGLTHCWNCGSDKQSKSKKNVIRLERCHIKPHALGGKDEPSNYVLMCHECHKNAPNSTNEKYLWEWFKTNKTNLSIYGTYAFMKATELYEQRKNKSFLIDVLPKVNGNIIDIFKNEMDKVGTHLNNFNVETYYTILCEIDDNHMTIT